MLHYFYRLKHSWFAASLRTALAASWRQRNFMPCRALCQDLASQRSIPDNAVVHAVLNGIGFDRTLWHALIDECLIFGADALPRIPCMIDALAALLAPHRLCADPGGRHGFTPIEQVYFGTRDLRLGGGWHRPERVGWNDSDDVARLLTYLQSVDVANWTADQLMPLADLPEAAEREEDLAFVRDWWPALVEMYAEAQADRQIIVCERP